jgi:Ca2+-binding RTX toxin-like protein
MRGNQSRRSLCVEQLESRRLLAAAKGGHAEIDATGVLNLSGNGKNDWIQVSTDGTQLWVTLNKQSFTFNNADVTGILIDGGNGNDRIWVDDGVTLGAVINGGAGNDRIHGGGGSDTIHGDKGNDWAWGGSGDDVVHGDAGNDHVFGGAGLDQLFGEGCHDALAGEGDDDQLFGGAGHDRLRGGDGNDQMWGEAGKDQLYGELGDDLLIGGGDNDKLWGGDGNDTIKGDAGNDHLNGGPGDDLLDGDSGKNHFRDGFVVDLDQHLVASLTRSDTNAAAGEARLTQVVVGGVVQTQFQVSVVGAALGETLNVSVDGMLIGTLMTDPTTGAGSATFDPSLLSVVVDEGSLIEIGPDLSLVVIRGTLAKAFA